MAIKDNVIQLDSVVRQLNETINKNVDALQKATTATANYGKSFSNVPSEYANQLKTTKTLLDEVKNSQEKLTKEEKENIVTLIKLNQLQRSQNATERSNITTRKALAVETERQAKKTRDLNSAYIQLSRQEAEASRRVQDLISRGKLATQTKREYNRELRNAKNDFNSLNQRVLSADRAVGRFNRNVGNYPKQAILGLKDLIGAFGIAGGLTLFATAVKDAFRLTKELQGLNNALKQVTGTQEEYLNQQAFLKQVSEDFGVQINGLTEQFTQFYVSAKGKIAGQEIQNIFKSITKAGATMGLSVDAQKRAFLALNQMMSKGVVSAEELRGQLGEALPGAFSIMAKALNTNEIGLNKMLKSGSLLANEVLPKFAKELEKAYGIENIERVNTLTSAQNRLSNSWTNLIKTLTEGEGGITSFLSNIINEVSKTINAWDRLFFKMKSVKTIFNTATTEAETFYFKQVQQESEKTGISIEKLAKTRIGLAIKMKDQIISEINALKEQNKEMEKGTPNKFLRDLSGMTNMISKNKSQIKDKIEQLGRVNGQLKAYTAILKPNTEEIKENTDTTNENVKAKVESVKVEKEQIKSVQDLTNIKIEENKAIDVNLENIEKQIEYYNNLKNKREEDAESLKKWLAEYRKGFQDDFISNSGFDKLFFLIENFDKLKTSGVDTALAISEAFQQAFNTISEASQGNFDREFERLEMQKEISLKFAGDSSSAKEEIERQYEEKRKAIQKRQAESQKELAIFNIAVNTAQAIIATLAQTPPPAGIPLAVAMGVIGAVQAGLVASKQIPQFWKGGTHDGGLMMVNDGKESKYQETVVTPDGKIMKPKGRNVIMNAPKGTEIYTHSQWHDYLNNQITSLGIDPLGSYLNIAPKVEIKGSDNTEVRNEIVKLAKIIKNKDAVNISIDKKGVNVTEGGKEYLNSRLKLKAQSV